MFQCKGRHYIPIKRCNQGPKDVCGYTDIAMDEVHKFLMIGIVMVLLFFGCIDNLLTFKQALDEYIKPIYPNIILL